MDREAVAKINGYVALLKEATQDFGAACTTTGMTAHEILELLNAPVMRPNYVSISTIRVLSTIGRKRRNRRARGRKLAANHQKARA